MHHRRTKWVWTDGFSSGVWRWECFCTVECQQVESSRWMEQQQKSAKGASSVCMWGTTSSRASDEHRARDGPWYTVYIVGEGHCHDVISVVDQTNVRTYTGIVSYTASLQLFKTVRFSLFVTKFNFNSWLHTIKKVKCSKFYDWKFCALSGGNQFSAISASEQVASAAFHVKFYILIAYTAVMYVTSQVAYTAASHAMAIYNHMLCGLYERLGPIMPRASVA